MPLSIIFYSQDLGVLDPEYLSDALKTIFEEKGKEKHGSSATSVIAAGYTDGSIELFRLVRTYIT